SVLMACPECDLLHRVSAPPRGGVSLCTRCGATLRRGGVASMDVALALHIAALILFCLANAFPLLSIRLHGTVQEASIPGSVRLLSNLGWPWLSAVLITTVILAPLAHLGGMIYVLLQVRGRHSNRWTMLVFRIVEQFGAWGMAEVFVLGILVSYVKLAKMAAVVPGPSLFALGAFIVVAAAAVSALDLGSVWEALGTRSEATPSQAPKGALTAKEANLAACPSCGFLAPLKNAACPRCGATLHSRKLNSRERTWALLITAILLYLPANFLPVMRVVSLGRTQSDTIMSGVFYFLRTGSWHLALIIFIASVVVPIAKIIILAILLISERRGSPRWPEHRARLYRLTEMVGRWSMVDIFVLTLMVALVEMGSVATITPGPGSMAFAMMVFSTMLAVQCFDPRLVWDSLTVAPNKTEGT
ncbi:MAG: paraquat-inducible protein A, partial [Acidobacteriota bacterium]|nr:paraquat-inducible protein A [Acidobacteriota bacterium]